MYNLVIAFHQDLHLSIVLFYFVFVGIERVRLKYSTSKTGSRSFRAELDDFGGRVRLVNSVLCLPHIAKSTLAQLAD